MDTVDVDPKLDNNKEDQTYSVPETEESREETTKSQFDPKLSSREMRKIKYYEDMFARMANETKQVQNDQTQTTGITLSRTRRVQDKKKLNYQKQETPYSSLEEFKHDGIDQVYPTTSKPGRKQVYKKITSSLESDYEPNKFKSESLQEQTPLTDGKALLDNKRLIKVQSMPMVTKKQKTPLPPAVEPKQHSEPRTRRSKVSRWDVKTRYPSPGRETKPAPEVPVEQEKKVEQVPTELDKSLSKEEFVGEEVFNEVDMELETSNEEQQKYPEQPQETQETQQKEEEQLDLYQDQKDLPLDVEEFLAEDTKEHPVETLPPEFETNLEEQYPLEQMQMQVQAPVKKKSNRGRKAKHKKTTPTSMYVGETNQELDSLALTEYTPVSPESDFLEEVKPVTKQRPRSQRNRRKKEQYEGERPPTKSKSTPKSGKGMGRNHSGSGEKTEKLQSGSNKRDLGELTEEKFISVENLRMITMEEAQKMINLSIENKVDLESLRNLMNKMCNDNYTNEVNKKKDANSVNRFLLDPANIVAPACNSYQEESDPPVPENPLQLSFKYRQFHDLSKF